jgi:hypothetical protein
VRKIVVIASRLFENFQIFLITFKTEFQIEAGNMTLTVIHLFHSIVLSDVSTLKEKYLFILQCHTGF